MSHTCYGEGCEICELHELQEQFTHWSDCAQHNEPAEPAGPCDCGMYHIPTLERVHEELTTLRAELAAAREEVKHLELFHAAYAETASTEIQQAYQREDVALAKLSRYTELEKASADFVYEREYFIDVRKRMHRILDTLKKEDV